MISSGRFVLGEECAPFRITKYRPVNGKMTPQDIYVHAIKVPLKQLRQRLLNKQLKYMRLTPETEINAMREHVEERLAALDVIHGHGRSFANSSFAMRDQEAYACGMTMQQSSKWDSS